MTWYHYSSVTTSFNTLIVKNNIYHIVSLPTTTLASWGSGGSDLLVRKSISLSPSFTLTALVAVMNHNCKTFNPGTITLIGSFQQSICNHIGSSRFALYCHVNSYCSCKYQKASNSLVWLLKWTTKALTKAAYTVQADIFQSVSQHRLELLLLTGLEQTSALHCWFAYWMGSSAFIIKLLKHCSKT